MPCAPTFLGWPLLYEWHVDGRCWCVYQAEGGLFYTPCMGTT